MVSRAISRLQHGRARDHVGLQAEHLIYGRETLAPLIAHLFNRALAEGFPEIWHTYIQRTWVDPGLELPSKMLHYREHFLQLSEQGFIEIPLYMQRYMPHHLRVVIGQLRVSSHQLEIERGRARGLPRDERICPICHTEVESEEHFMVRCPAYSALRVQFGMEDTLQQCIARSDQVQLGRFLTVALGIREQILQPRLQAGERTQRAITEFFQREVSSDLSHYPQRHVALKIMYFGARFHGFASDASPQRTVELELFRALEKTRLVTKGRLEAKYTRCGRTDKGVSANGQVVALLLRSRQKHSDHMNVSAREDRVAAAIYSRSEELHFSQMIDYEEIDYVGVLNRALPPDIRILGWCYVPLNFHARFSCLGREYNYFFLIDGLDIEAMKRAAKKFCGEHDFRNFCRMDADSVQNFRREILALEIFPCLDTWEGFEIWMFRVQGTAFLWHQVRCMVAVLLMVGQNKEHESALYKHCVQKSRGDATSSLSLKVYQTENGEVMMDMKVSTSAILSSWCMMQDEPPWRVKVPVNLTQ
ncbi:hypothetical protein L7F22_065790 [Adiantum nelumboides]|nr:hypothetical protein [Adiantum nelumboides]